MIMITKMYFFYQLIYLKKVMRGMLEKNQEEMNKNWHNKNQQKENIRIMGIDSKHQVLFILR